MTTHRFSTLAGLFLSTGVLVLSPLAAKADPRVDAAVRAARQIVTDAQQNASFANTFYENQRMSAILSSVKEVLVPEYFALPERGQDFPICIDTPAEMAFTIFPGTLERLQGQYSCMGICKRALTLDVQDLAELAVHEAIHFSFGETDECGTTELEIKIMKAAGRLPFRNGYVEQCRLSALGPFSKDLVVGAGPR